MFGRLSGNSRRGGTMPRSSDPVAVLQGTARRILELIEGEIRRLEKQLAEMRASAEAWVAALLGGGRRRGRPPGSAARRSFAAAARRRGPGRPPKARRGRPAKRLAQTRTRRAVPRPARRASPAVDWDAILPKL